MLCHVGGSIDRPALTGIIIWNWAREDLARLALAPEQQLRIGKEVACLAVLTLLESGPTANRLAPIVINIANLKALQAIVQEFGYSHQHVLPPAEAITCS